MKVTGIDGLLTKLKLVSKDAPVAVAFGLYDGGQDIAVVAKERAPKRSGDMAMSIFVSPPSVGGAEASLEIGAGGKSAEYVLRVHEDLSMKHPNGGEAKFLQTALDDGRPNLIQKVVDRVTRFLITGRTTPVAKRTPATPWEGGG